MGVKNIDAWEDMHYICSNAIFVSVTKIVDFDSMYGLQHLKITIKANHIETILSSIIKQRSMAYIIVVAD